MRKARVLVSLRRRVAAVRQGDYHGLWSELRDSAEAAGAHAWRFSASGDAALFLEFLEFGAGADPRSQPRVRELLARLESEAGVAAAEEWRELPE